MRPLVKYHRRDVGGDKKITAGILTGILTRMSVKMPAVILMSGAAALLSTFM